MATKKKEVTEETPVMEKPKKKATSKKKVEPEVKQLEDNETLIDTGNVELTVKDAKNLVSLASEPKRSKATTKVFRELYDEVVHVPVKEVCSEREFPDRLSHAVYIPSKNKIVNITGKSYKLMTNRQLIEPIYNQLVEIYGKGGIKVHNTNYDDCFFISQMEVSSLMMEDGNKVKVMVENSYDSSYRYRVSVFLEKPTSEDNGYWAFGLEMVTSHKHVKNSNYEIEDLQEKIKSISEVYEMMNSLREHKLQKDSVMGFFEQIIEQPIASLSKRSIKTVQELYEKNLEETGLDHNLFSLYTCFNEVINNHLWDNNIAEKRILDKDVWKVLSHSFKFKRPLSVNSLKFS